MRHPPATEWLPQRYHVTDKGWRHAEGGYERERDDPGVLGRPEIVKSTETVGFGICG
jgi:hypothetical protein